MAYRFIGKFTKSRKTCDSLSDKYQADVILLYVAVDLCAFFPAFGNYPSVEHLNNFRDWELGKARKRLERICDEQLKACPNLRIRLVTGDPVSHILNMVEKENADMIVLTSHGEGQKNQNNPELGNVTGKVIRLSPVPVHVVNPLDS